MKGLEFFDIPRAKVVSMNSLRKVRDALDVRFPNTGVRVDCPAVAVPFGSLGTETTEVVPADYVKDENGYMPGAFVCYEKLSIRQSVLNRSESKGSERVKAMGRRFRGSTVEYYSHL